MPSGWQSSPYSRTAVAGTTGESSGASFGSTAQDAAGATYRASSATGGPPTTIAFALGRSRASGPRLSKLLKLPPHLGRPRSSHQQTFTAEMGHLRLQAGCLGEGLVRLRSWHEPT